MLVDEDFLLEDLEELYRFDKEKTKQNDRLEKIKYEFNLYKMFCKLCNIKMCNYSSLVDFQNYCKQNFIQLL